MDLFTWEQYIAFHGKLPPADWKEATPADIRRAAGNERPNAVFISSPCKGASGLLSETLSKTPKYQAYNELTLRCVWLMAEAWADDPVDLIVFENVPRVATRARHLIDQINQLLARYGFAAAETTHDCGVIGGLAQSRKRFLLVARHIEKVPPFLYEPEKKQLRAVGDVLGRMPLAGDVRGGPMHRIPNLQWKTWVRLAFVEAGGDWRSLNKLAVTNGHLSDYLILPERHRDYLGVNRWTESTGAISGRGTPTTGAYSIADPRFDSGNYDCGQYGLCGWKETMGAVINVKSPGQGTFSVQDPRLPANAAVDRYAITPAAECSTDGALTVQDPRALHRTAGDAYLTGGHYGVVPWSGPSGAVSAAAGYDNGRWSVADPRTDMSTLLPAPSQKTVAVIRALDGTWHRPFTTLELAAIQSLIDPDEHWSDDPQTQAEIDLKKKGDYLAGLVLHGYSDSAHRERIGNAVPPDAAESIADVMGVTLLLARSGETFVLSAMPIWVQPVAIALSLAQRAAS